ncbi:MAG: hypothetical protein ABR563_13765 [Pyrinomonadaceae bacterium]
MPFKDPEKRRAYQREYKRRWYRENRAKHVGYVRNRDGKIQEWFVGYKQTLACEVCGESHPACLDFHHIDPREKKFSVSTRRDRPSLQALKDEIAKCRVLCSNCHRKEHWEERMKRKAGG